MSVKLDKTLYTRSSTGALRVAKGRQLYVLEENGPTTRSINPDDIEATETLVEGFSDADLTVSAGTGPFAANADGQFVELYFPTANYDLYTPADRTNPITRWQPLGAGVPAEVADLDTRLDAVENSNLGKAGVAVANTFTQPQTVKGNVYQRDSHDQLLVTLAPTANSEDAFGGQVLLHGSASGEVNKRLWYWAVDVVATVPYRDSVWGKILPNGDASDVDGIYISHGGEGPATIGIGLAQPEAYGTYHRAKIQGPPATDHAAGGVLQLSQGNGSPTGPLLRATSAAGTDRWVLDPSNSNTWAVRQYGDAGTANPVLVVQDVGVGNKEQMRLTANGKIQWADPATGTLDANALLSRSGAGRLQVAQNLAIGNLCGVGPAFAAGDLAPTAQMDVATTGAVAANLYVRNTTQGTLMITMAGSGNEARIYTSNASAIKIGPAATARMTISGAGNVSFASANKPTLPADATDLPSAIALVNAMKAKDQLYGLAA